MTDRENSGFSFNDIFLFIKKHPKKLFMPAGISLIFVLLLIAISWCLLPRNSHYVQKITILLENRNNQQVYPSGKPFSNADCLSPLVLQQVYRDNHLETRVPFEQFCRMFYVSNADFRLAAINALFSEKMNKKNISIVDMNRLEKEYREEIAKNGLGPLEISFSPDFAISESEAAKILNSIPQSWYAIYSKLEAQRFPQMETNASLQEFRRSIGQGGQLILLEKSRIFCEQLIQMCDQLNEMLQGQNVSLPDGEYLGDIRKQLLSLKRYQIDVFLQYVLAHRELQGAYDQIFLKSRLKQLEYELVRMNNKYQGVLDSMQIISDTQPHNNVSDTKNKNSSLTLQLDNGFFNSLVELIRHDATNEMRKTYAGKSLKYKETIAEMEAEKEYCLQMLEMRKNESAVPIDKQTLISREKFQKNMQDMLNELEQLNTKVTQFRDLIVSQYLSSRQFYAVDSPVSFSSELCYPMKRISLGMLLLWLLGNLVHGLICFRRLD